MGDQEEWFDSQRNQEDTWHSQKIKQLWDQDDTESTTQRPLRTAQDILLIFPMAYQLRLSQEL